MRTRLLSQLAFAGLLSVVYEAGQPKGELLRLVLGIRYLTMFFFQVQTQAGLLTLQQFCLLPLQEKQPHGRIVVLRTQRTDYQTHW